MEKLPKIQKEAFCPFNYYAITLLEMLNNKRPDQATISRVERLLRDCCKNLNKLSG